MSNCNVQCRQEVVRDALKREQLLLRNPVMNDGYFLDSMGEAPPVRATLTS